MDRHSIVLRTANPTFDEGLAFARYVDEATEGSAHTALREQEWVLCCEDSTSLQFYTVCLIIVRRRRTIWIGIR